MNDATLLKIKTMSNDDLNKEAALSNYRFDSHYESCPYCRNRRAQQLAPCTLSQTLHAMVEALEAEQEHRMVEADVESERCAEAAWN